MPDRFIDRDYADAFIGTDTVAALFTDESDSGVFSTAKFNQVVETASSSARSALKAVGYTVSGTNISSELVKLATLNLFIPLAYSRKQQAVPDDLMAVVQGLLEDVRSGALPELEATPDPAGAVGGHVWSETSADVADAIVNPLKNLTDYM